MVNPFRRSKSPTRKAHKDGGNGEHETVMTISTPGGAVSSRSSGSLSGRRSVSPGKISSGSRATPDMSRGILEEYEKNNKAFMEEDKGSVEVTALPSIPLMEMTRSAAAERQLMSGNAFYQRFQKPKDKKKIGFQIGSLPSTGEIAPKMVQDEASSNTTARPPLNNASVCEDHFDPVHKHTHLPLLRNRVKPPPLKLATISQETKTNMKNTDTDANALENNEDKSHRPKFFNMKSLMSPKGKEHSGFRFNKQNRGQVTTDADIMAEGDEYNLVNRPLVFGDTPERKGSVINANGDVPLDTPPKAMKMLGLNDGSRKLSKAERVLGAQYIHDSSAKKPDYRLQDALRNQESNMTPKRRHAYDEPYPASDEDTTPRANHLNTMTKAQYRAYQELYHMQNNGSSLSPGLLSRGKSLRYIDNEGPPTPPEKDTLKIARHAGSEMQYSSSLGDQPGFVKIFNPEALAQRRGTNILALGANKSEHQDLQPAFYTPSVYSCSSQYTRPSRNHDSQVYFLPLPSTSKNNSTPDTTSPPILEPGSNSDGDSDDSAVPNTADSNTLVDAASNDKKSMESLAAEVSTMSLDKVTEGFKPAHPSAVPTPLYKRSMNSIGDHRARADSGESNSFGSGRVPIAPPADLLTHFGVMNDHLRLATMTTHHHLHSAGQEIMSEIQSQHRSTVVSFNDSMQTVYISMGQMEQKITALVDTAANSKSKTDATSETVIDLKANVDKNIGEIKDSIDHITNSLHGLVATSDKVLTLNKIMSKKITELVQRVQQLESTQGSIVAFLSNRHASFPPPGIFAAPTAHAIRHVYQSHDHPSHHHGQSSYRHEQIGARPAGSMRHPAHDNGRHGNTKPSVHTHSVHGVGMDQSSANAFHPQPSRGARVSVHPQPGDSHHDEGHHQAYSNYAHQSIHDPFNTQNSSPVDGQHSTRNAGSFNWSGSWDMDQANQHSYYYGHPALNILGFEAFSGTAQATQNEKCDAVEQEKENQKEDN